MTLGLYALSTLTVFLVSFVKTFQQRNIIYGHIKSAFFTSWVVTGLEVASISFVVIGGWTVIFSAGIGGSIGVVVAMKMHSRLYTKK